MSTQRLAKLAAIGTAAGVFSGLFGVGGGTVIVPLLIFWFGYSVHEATGTSLAAIALVALWGVLAQGLYGNVSVEKALLVGVPALAGVIAGAALQQKLSERVVSIAFAGLLVVVAIQLIAGASGGST